MFIQTYWLSLAILLTGALTQAQSLPKPQCYRDNAEGTATRGAKECAKFIDAFCTNVAIMFPPSSIHVGESARRCFNLDDNRRCDFVTFNTLGLDVNPNHANCVRVLNNIANTCPNDLGGFGQVAPSSAYTFGIDPNTGSCALGVQAGN